MDAVLDVGGVYDPYAPSFLQIHNPDPVVFERGMPNYDVKHLSGARNPPVNSGKEMLHYSVPLVSSDLLVDRLLDSFGTACQMPSLTPREQLLPRNDLMTDLHYSSSIPQYDDYQQRMNWDMNNAARTDACAASGKVEKQGLLVFIDSAPNDCDCTRTTRAAKRWGFNGAM